MEQENRSELARISQQAAQNGLMTPEDVQGIQISLWNLLARQTERYTMGDSTSITVETAEELLQSISFTLGLALEGEWQRGAHLLRSTPLPELLRTGQAELERLIAEGRQLLQQVKESQPAVDNRSYTDTLVGMDTFFKRYDYRFFAHQIPGDIDYQLCNPVPPALEGITYINEYLGRLLVENEFCNHFATRTLKALLRSYCPDYVGLLVNLFHPAAVNALGLALMGGDVFGLDMTPGDRQALLRRLKGHGAEELAARLQDTAGILCYRLRMEDGRARTYVEETAAELVPRLATALEHGNLDGIFLSLSET